MQTYAELECLLLVWWVGLKCGNSDLIYAWKFPSKHTGMKSGWGVYSTIMVLGIIKIVVNHQPTSSVSGEVRSAPVFQLCPPTMTTLDLRASYTKAISKSS